MTKVFWAVLLERAVGEHAVSALLGVALHCGERGYPRLVLPYTRTDVARNRYVAAFLQHSKNPDDTLVMLDADHNHPQDIVSRLASHSVGVVGALAFRRCEPHDPCFFVRGPDNLMHPMATWDSSDTLIAGAVVGTGAIAIKRAVFSHLEANGYEWPFFRYAYVPGSINFPTEDVYFGNICEKAGIAHHVDVSLVTPHITAAEVDAESWEKARADLGLHVESVSQAPDIKIANLRTRVNV